GDRSSLATVLGLDPNDPPADLGTQAAQALADRLEGPAPGQDDVLTKLADAGFVSLPQLGQGGVAGIAGPGQGIVVLAGGARDLAVIPALNEADVIADTVKHLYHLDPVDVVAVVDDGSADGTARAAGSAGAFVLRSPRRLGKGGALEGAFERLPRPSVYLLV